MTGSVILNQIYTAVSQTWITQSWQCIYSRDNIIWICLTILSEVYKMAGKQTSWSNSQSKYHLQIIPSNLALRTEVKFVESHPQRLNCILFFLFSHHLKLIHFKWYDSMLLRPQCQGCLRWSLFKSWCGYPNYSLAMNLPAFW